MNTRGFTLFFAMLAASLALSIGLAIYDITAREINISSTVSQSEYAIYAADTGAECALYWDAKHGDFATSSASTIPPSGSNIDCNGIDLSTVWNTSQRTASAATTTFTIDFSHTTPNEPYCAYVTVAKAGSPSYTTIVAHGYNTCVSGPLRLERALKVTY